MKAKEVLRQYANGERDFRRHNLRGANFKGKDLVGADFSECDIRGANFAGANLRGAKFCGAKAGLQKRWATFWVLASCGLSAISGLLLAFAVSLVVSLYTSDTGLISVKHPLNFALAIIVFIGLFTLILIRNLIAGLATINIAVFCGEFASFDSTLIRAFAIIVPVIVAIAIAEAITIAVVKSRFGVFAVVLISFFAIVGAIAFSIALATIGTAVVVKVIAYSVSVILFSSYVSWRAMHGDRRDTWIKALAISLPGLTATRFHGADLTDANFTRANLKLANFRQARLIRTCWRDARQINRICHDLSYLANPQICQLLITGEGRGLNCDRLDLRGINLQEAKLANASFIDADLSQSNLKGADLFEAKLVRTNLDLTDLSEASLTGSYIEDWGITHRTNLDEVKCEYIYLKLPTEGDRVSNRIPPSEQGKFGEGDFNIFIRSVLDTLDLYHKQNINAGVAITVLKGLTKDYPVCFELVGIEKRGNDQFLIRLKVFGKLSDFKIRREYYARYEQTLPLFDPKGLLPSTEKLVADIIEQVKQNPGTHIENLYNQGIMIEGDRIINTRGGDAIGNILGDSSTINSTVTQTINQLPDSPTDQPGIKELLVELQNKIAAANLDEEDKALAEH